MMHAETFELLRHVEVNGPRTRPEVAKGLQRGVGDVTKTLNNLVTMGYLTRDESTLPISYSLTGKARKKLAQPFTPTPKSTKPRKSRARPDPHAKLLSATAAGRIARRVSDDTRAYVRRLREQLAGDTAPRYTASEFTASTRPGAMVAFTLPSRVGDRLHFRDGTVTDLDGNTLF